MPQKKQLYSVITQNLTFSKKANAKQSVSKQKQNFQLVRKHSVRKQKQNFQMQNIKLESQRKTLKCKH